MKLRNFLLAATMFILPAVGARAQVIDGPYAAVGAGVNFLQDENAGLVTDRPSPPDTRTAGSVPMWS